MLFGLLQDRSDEDVPSKTCVDDQIGTSATCGIDGLIQSANCFAAAITGASGSFVSFQEHQRLWEVVGALLAPVPNGAAGVQRPLLEACLLQGHATARGILKLNGDVQTALLCAIPMLSWPVQGGFSSGNEGSSAF